MGRNAAVLLGLVVIGLGPVAHGQSASRSGFTELHRAEIDGVELVMGLIERPGQSQGAKHYHPGGEFGFVLQGAVTISTEKDPLVTVKAGSSFYQPPGEWHMVDTAAAGAQTVVFRVLKPGQPMVIPAE